MPETFEIKAIGKIVSSAKESGDIPLQGLPAEAHIFPEFSEALDGIDDHSHVFVICWMHLADRRRLKVVPKRVSADLPPKGVFALRSPVRPNPIALCPTRLLGRDGNTLYLENIDMIDGTPIIDIKPYSIGWDCIFSARNNSTYEVYSKMRTEDALDDMLRQAANFHGDRCVGVSIGVRAAYAALNHFQCDLQNKNFTVNARVRGCIADALQSLFGIGNKRFSHGEPEDTIIISKNGRRLILKITKDKFENVDEVLAAPDDKLFSVIKKES